MEEAKENSEQVQNEGGSLYTKTWPTELGPSQEKTTLLRESGSGRFGAEVASVTGRLWFMMYC